MVALRVRDSWFWTANTRKNLNFLRCIHVFDPVLKNRSDIKVGIKQQLLFYFFVLMDIAASNIGMSFFICISGFRLKVSPIAVSRNRFQLESKTDLTTIGLFLEFFFAICHVSSTSYLYGLKIARIFLSWRHQVFSIVGVGGILVCALEIRVIFSNRLLWYRLIRFSIGMQLYLKSFFRCPF